MTTTDTKPNKRKIKVAPFRMSFPALLVAKEDEETKRKTFQLTMLYPPGLDRGPFMAALKEAMIFKHGEDQSKWPKLKRKPSDVVVDFEEYNSGRDKPLSGDWKGWTMVRANSPETHPPGVVGPTKNAAGKFPAITDAREIYGGRWARATIEAFYYDSPRGGKGVTFGLKNVQVLKHDTNFSGAVSAPEEDFDDAPEEWSGEADAFEKGGEQTKTSDAGDDWN